MLSAKSAETVASGDDTGNASRNDLRSNDSCEHRTPPTKSWKLEVRTTVISVVVVGILALLRSSYDTVNDLPKWKQDVEKWRATADERQKQLDDKQQQIAEWQAKADENSRHTREWQDRAQATLDKLLDVKTELAVVTAKVADLDQIVRQRQPQRQATIPLPEAARSISSLIRDVKDRDLPVASLAEHPQQPATEDVRTETSPLTYEAVYGEESRSTPESRSTSDANDASIVAQLRYHFGGVRHDAGRELPSGGRRSISALPPLWQRPRN